MFFVLETKLRRRELRSVWENRVWSTKCEDDLLGPELP